MIATVTLKDLKSHLKAANVLKNARHNDSDKIMLRTLDDTELELERFDGDVSFRSKLTAHVKEEGAACVSFSQLLSALKTANGDIVFLECKHFDDNSKDDFKMTVTVDYDTYHIDAYKTEPFDSKYWTPDDGKIIGDKLDVLAPCIGELFKTATPFLDAAERSRRFLYHLLLFVEDKNIVAVASDSHRIAVVKNEYFQQHSPDCRFLIPITMISAASKLLKKAEHVSVWNTTERLNVKIDGVTLTAQRSNFDFPPYQKIFDQLKNRVASAIFDVNELKSAFERALPFAKQHTFKTVECHLNDGFLKIRVLDDKNKPTFETNIAPEGYIGDSEPFLINCRYVLDAIKNLSGKITLCYFGKGKYLMFEFEAPFFAFDAVICPIKPNP